MLHLSRLVRSACTHLPRRGGSLCGRHATAQLSHEPRTDTIGRKAHLAAGFPSARSSPRAGGQRSAPGLASAGPSATVRLELGIAAVPGRSRRAGSRGSSGPSWLRGKRWSRAARAARRRATRLSLSKRPTAAATCASGSCGFEARRPRDRAARPTPDGPRAGAASPCSSSRLVFVGAEHGIGAAVGRRK